MDSPARPRERSVRPLHRARGPAQQQHPCILEDRLGRLWLSTQKGVSRFDPLTETFRNYDVSDGLQSDELSETVFSQAPDGEISSAAATGSTRSPPRTSRTTPTCRRS